MTDNQNHTREIVLKLDTDERTLNKYSAQLQTYKGSASAVAALGICYLSVSLIAGIISYFGLLYVLSILKLESAKSSV